MMKKTLIAGSALSAVALLMTAKDPVIMTVDGVNVPKSEFEYLYHKNSQQQINPQTLDEYVDMFKLYKMKVAEARAEGLDTMASFIKETDQYRHDLAAPYLADSVMINRFVDEAYDRSLSEVEANHIMLFKTRDAVRNHEIRQRADSLREELRKGADFEDLARRFSGDRASSERGGRMGWIVANNFPYTFDKTAFSLSEGEISDVVESPMGYHILKGGHKRPARGKVRASHILKMTRGLDEAGQAKAKQEIDSIYELVKAAPGRFAEIASTASEDRGSARQGGSLPAFGAGEMVEEFDSVAFSLRDGEISQPFQSPFGWHIIYRQASRPVPGREAIKPQILQKLSSPSDPRFVELRDAQTARLEKKHKGKLNTKSLDTLRSYIAANGLDSLFAMRWNIPETQVLEFASVDGKSIPMKNLLGQLAAVRQPDPRTALEILDTNIPAAYNAALVDAEIERLEKDEPDYRNLLKEYVDGSLLYEVSVRKVWDKAANDKAGLEKFFLAHKQDYAWNAPHAKGILVQCTDDSVANLIRARAAELPSDSIVTVIRKEFPRIAGIDRVLVAKGSNALVDNIMFGGPEVEPAKSNFKVYFMLEPRLISMPEEVADVRGLVTSDYQNQCQAAWEEELRRRYPVTVNAKVLRSVKPIGTEKK